MDTSKTLNRGKTSRLVCEVVKHGMLEVSMPDLLEIVVFMANKEVHYLGEIPQLK